MIDIATENLIPINQLRDWLPSAQRGKSLGTATIYRWLQTGLESVKIGGTRYTSREAIARFAEQNKEKPSPPPPPQPRRFTPPDDAIAAREQLRKLIPGIN